MSEAREMRFAAEVGLVDEAQAFVDEILEANGCGMKTQMQIDIAVEELFVNIASYAFPGGSGDAVISVAMEGDSVVITFKDRGIPYDPVAKEDPDITLSADDRKIGGLGIYMVKKSMDSMTYERRDGQNVLTITKRIRGAQ